MNVSHEASSLTTSLPTLMLGRSEWSPTVSFARIADVANALEAVLQLADRITDAAARLVDNLSAIVRGVGGSMGRCACKKLPNSPNSPLEVDALIAQTAKRR